MSDSVHNISERLVSASSASLASSSVARISSAINRDADSWLRKFRYTTYEGTRRAGCNLILSSVYTVIIPAVELLTAESERCTS